jgi:putative transposase
VRDLALLFLHLLATVARLAGPGGTRSVVAESVLVQQQLLILNRSRKRSPHLRPSDRVVAGLCALFMRPGRRIRSAIVVKPSTLLSLHRALIQRKYRRLFSSKGPTKPGPKGPSQDVIAAVVDMKQRNPIWGCPRIAQQITLVCSAITPYYGAPLTPLCVPTGIHDATLRGLGWRSRTHDQESDDHSSAPAG